MITKPMLAGTVKDMKTIQYPVLVTPKLDGIRCLKLCGKAVSRNFKPIPNEFVRSWIEKHLPDGVDGELIVENESFQATSSAVMRESGEPKVVYHVFDFVEEQTERSTHRYYMDRMKDLKENKQIRTLDEKRVKLILPILVTNEQTLLEFETKCLAEGYEGVMLRTPDGPYKCGRSKVREGFLLKLKRFSDDEAEIIGFEERMHNANEAKKDAFGRTERSTHKANMVATGVLGAFRVKSKKFNKEFSIGTGMNDVQRASYWEIRAKLVGKLLKYKYQPTGIKDVPRFPVFLGLRHENDLGE